MRRVIHLALVALTVSSCKQASQSVVKDDGIEADGGDTAGTEAAATDDTCSTDGEGLSLSRGLSPGASTLLALFNPIPTSPGDVFLQVLQTGYRRDNLEAAEMRQVLRSIQSTLNEIGRFPLPLREEFRQEITDAVKQSSSWIPWCISFLPTASGFEEISAAWNQDAALKTVNERMREANASFRADQVGTCTIRATCKYRSSGMCTFRCNATAVYALATSGATRGRCAVGYSLVDIESWCRQADVNPSGYDFVEIGDPQSSRFSE